MGVCAAATFAAREIAEATGGKLLWGAEGMMTAGVSTDSRQMEAGALFIPLRGPNFDGHDFLEAAMEKGAAGVLVEKGRQVSRKDGVFAVAVPDPLQALGDLARWHRRRHEVQVVAVTGSNGKTTTKEMAAAILEEGGTTLKSEGNLNNFIGLPHQVLRLEAGHARAVFEMGMNRPGEIRRLAEIAMPGVALITNVAMAHLEGLGSIEAVRDAKGELLEVMGAEGTAVLSADDEQSRILAERFEDVGGRAVRFGFSEDAEVRAEDVHAVDRAGMYFTLRMDGERAEVQIPALGRHNVRNALAAAAAASLLGSTMDEIRTGLGKALLPAMRFSVSEIPGRSGCTLLNDAYNANPASLVEALETGAALKGGGRLFALLGDMKELGDFSAGAHAEAGRQAAGQADFFAAVGPEMARAAESARAAGMAPDRVGHFDAPRAAAAWMAAHLQPGDFVLLKGSRSMKMESAEEELRG